MSLSALKPFTYDTQKYDAFIGYITERIEREARQLESLTDPVYIYKTQGRISILRSLLSLREEVHSAEK